MQNREFIGCGSSSSLGSVLNDLGVQKIFLVSGNGSFSSIQEKYDFNKTLGKYAVRRFFDYSSNPNLDDVIEGIGLLKQFDPDIVLSIGGGSAIDMGKLINTLSAQDTDDYENIIETNNIVNGGLPFIAIPTTSGTGSESTHFAAVFINGNKFSLSHETMLPAITIIDPELTYSMPSYLAACTGMDALSQAVESFWAKSSSKKSKAFAKEAIELILNSIEDAVCRKDRKAMIAMSIASNLSGKAINISKTTAPHALSYGLTEKFQIPHGHAVSLSMGRFFIINSSFDPKRLSENLNLNDHEETMRQLFNLFGVADAKDCCEKWNSIMDKIGLERSFSKLGVLKQEEIDSLVDNVNMERLGNNPVSVSRETLAEVFSED